MVLSKLIKAVCCAATAGGREAHVVPILLGCSLILCAGCSSSNDYGPQASPAVVVSGAQKSIEQLKANKTMPDSIKKAEIAHLEGEIAQAQGKATPAQKGLPANLTK